MLVSFALAHIVLRWWVRRHARHVARAGEPAGDSAVSAAGEPTVQKDARRRRWVSRGLTTLAPPIALLIWIHGLYFAVGLLIREAGDQQLGQLVLDTLTQIYRFSVVGALCWLLSRVGQLMEMVLLSLSARTENSWDDVVLPLVGKAARRALPLLALILGAPALSTAPAVAEIVSNATSLLLIGVVATILFQVVDAGALFVLRQHRLDVSDNLQARAITTQVTVLKKVAMTVIGVFTVASMLMVFDSVRQFGASILA
ncbi:MAG: hypothetical protein KA205_08585, partial [Acidobacteria bacterium]|nr:hypothetical protein [Acidobacteriota bacterium]